MPRDALIPPSPSVAAEAPPWAADYSHDVTAFLIALLRRIRALETRGGGGTGADEVAIGPADPGASYELWYDTDATAPTLAAWLSMTRAAYEALPTKDPATLYVIRG